MIWKFYSSVSLKRQSSFISWNQEDQSFDDDDDYEDNGSSVGERHAVESSVKDLNVNYSKKTTQERQNSKKNVKNSKDMEELEITKELHEQITPKQKKRNCLSLIRKIFTLATELRELLNL